MLSALDVRGGELPEGSVLTLSGIDDFGRSIQSRDVEDRRLDLEAGHAAGDGAGEFDGDAVHEGVWGLGRWSHGQGLGRR